MFGGQSRLQETENSFSSKCFLGQSRLQEIENLVQELALTVRNSNTFSSLVLMLDLDGLEIWIWIDLNCTILLESFYFLGVIPRSMKQFFDIFKVGVLNTK
ncbi:unnamed protein product [Vicia faba]|uniref:Uncharacterized protein n=1 Tax=Vicia faba TaxID=3906 RepID=A0AAV1B901_VICFA|nr:unnamed protein product [Vicia faba]